MEINLVSIIWETTQNIDYVDLEDLKRFSMDNSAPRKQKSTDFYIPPPGKKIASTDQCQNYRSDMQHCTKNMFYSKKNSSKLCAECAIGNLMNVLHRPENLGLEFQFLVPISGTPIRSGIPILFSIPKIPVRFFFRIPLLKNQKIGILIPKFGIPKKIKGHLFIYLALAKPALPGQFVLLVSSQSKEKS